MEKTAQLVLQVAGRAGRADHPGEVVMQTRHPDHPMLNALIREGYSAFAASELQMRKAAACPLQLSCVDSCRSDTPGLG
ncbi:hypothetical protein [Nitrincola sp. A-D6]|uniref:hypothetical protein n=1 Tax=Nitrincola sp. A-D6 TaxID=1545442 RepID=UPI000A6BF2C0